MTKPKDDVEVVSKPWEWPGEWLRDSTFWRDIVTRSASGLVVVLVVYVYGLIAGYFGTPSAAAKTLGLAGLLVAPVLILLHTLTMFGRNGKNRERVRKRLLLATYAAMAVTVLTLLFLVLTGQATPDTSFWP